MPDNAVPPPPILPMQSYFTSACVLIVLAILAGSLLTVAGMNQTQVASMVVTIMGFAALIFTQYHAAAQAAVRVEAVRREAKETADKVEEVRQQAKVAAEHAVEVKQTLARSTANTDRKLDGLEKVTAATHAFVNSDRGTLLELYAISLRQRADEHNNPADIHAAELAEKALAHHQAGQRIVDAQPGTVAEKGGAASTAPIEVVVVNPPDRPVPNRPVEGEGGDA